MTRVAVFTDNDFNKVNGVTTTLNAVVRHAPPEVAVRIYTAADIASDCRDYLAVPSVGMGLPWYREMRIYWPRLTRFAEALKADAIDVVHITTPGPVGLAGRLLAQKLGMPVIGSYHTLLGQYVETYSGSARLGRVMERYMLWMYSACASIMVPSRATLEFLEGAGYPRERLRVWTRGVDVATFTPERRRQGLRDAWHVDHRRPVVLYAGRLSREKGLDLFPEIQARLFAERVAHRLVFVGDGPMAAELKQRCPDAEFLGRVPHDVVADAMASADVFVFPSATDTLGNVVLEAQASGLPVIVSDRGGPKEVMSDGATGMVARAGDAQSFTEPLLRLLRDSAERAAMSQRARTLAMSRTWPDALVPLVSAWQLAAGQTQTSGARPSETVPLGQTA